MENYSESIIKNETKTKSLDPSQESLLRLEKKHDLCEIPLTPCSNLHLFEQLQIFLQQNNIPIQITTSIPSTSIQTGGGGDTESNSIVYQSETTPYSLFKGFMDTFFLQKQQENIQDTKNKQLLESIFSKDKSKKDIIHSLQTLSKQTSRDSRDSRDSREKAEPSKEPSQKKQITTTENNTLYMHIKTNHHNPIESIRGTKLYYLYQRQQNTQCAQFV